MAFILSRYINAEIYIHQMNLNI